MITANAQCCHRRYRALNSLLNGDDRSQLPLFYGYLRLFLGALRKLPKCGGRALLRGYPNQLEDAIAQYVVGTRLYWNGACLDTECAALRYI